VSIFPRGEGFARAFQSNEGHVWRGPYGTGFCWIRKELLAGLKPLQAYWLAMLSPDDLARPVDTKLPSQIDHKAFDIFGTANFFNFLPWNAAIDYLSTVSIATIADYDQQLIQRFIDGLDRRRFVVSSPHSGSLRISPHLYNTYADVDRALTILNET
jgi:selenocysteine lyase/cysteine desulfurase